MLILLLLYNQKEDITVTHRNNLERIVWSVSCVVMRVLRVFAGCRRRLILA